jgi:adenylate kinase family enzyme
MIRRILFALTTAALGTALAAPPGRIVILIGPPAAGKSAQAAFIHKQYGLPVVSADDLIQANPQAFARLKEFRVDDMEPHSDPVLNQLVRQKLHTVDLSKGVILDGYPATKGHADSLKALVEELGLIQEVTVFQLEVPDDVARQRVKRGKSSSVDPKTFEQQLKDYRREMGYVQVYFPNAKIHQLDGTKKSNVISKNIQSILGK